MLTRKILTTPMALLVILILFAACSNNGDDQKSVPQSTWPQCGPLMESYDCPKPPQGGTASSEIELPDGINIDRLEELRDLTYNECINVDAYEYLQPSTPEVLDSGAVFYFDCARGVYEWLFNGVPGDSWSVVLDTTQLTVPVEESGIPTDRRHPAYPNALTLRDLRAGLTVCVHDPDHPNSRDQEHTITNIYVITTTLFGYPRPTYDSLEGIAKDLIFPGVVPYPNGKWSLRYTTAGPCT